MPVEDWVASYRLTSSPRGRVYQSVVTIPISDKSSNRKLLDVYAILSHKGFYPVSAVYSCTRGLRIGEVV